MTTATKEMKVQKEEMLPKESERTRECRCFVPRADIYETEENITIVLDMPGIIEDNIDIALEKNILTVNGHSNLDKPEGYSLARAEYKLGDYERSFRLSNQIDQDKIEANYKNGVLRLSLAKEEKAKARKITVKAK